MRNFPQEIVDIVIDQLACILKGLVRRTHRPQDTISNYSTVCRRWVKRTQRNHFETLRLVGQRDLVKWSAAIGDEPSSYGASGHVKTLFLEDIETLRGFGKYFQAFTNVERAVLHCCTIFHSLDGVPLLKPLGSSLKVLEINGSDTSPDLMAQFLASLPKLEQFRVHNLTSPPRANPQAPHPIIPFFENAKEFALLSSDGYPANKLEWIPKTALFSGLTLGALCIRDNPEDVNKWIVSSRRTLENLSFVCDWDLDGSALGSLNLSGCNSLEDLYLLVPTDPGILTNIVLPSITSSKLSKLTLPLFTDTTWDMLKTLDRHLYQLAKTFRTAHDGRKMEIEFHIVQNRSLVAKFWKEKPMPKLAEEATIVPRLVNLL